MCKNRKPLRCPNCFAHDIDNMLRFDEGEQIYYCIMCCYEGNYDHTEEILLQYRKTKYPTLLLDF